METLIDTVKVIIDKCISCGTSFGIEEELLLELQKTGRVFYCPNGHSMVYSEPFEKQLKNAKEQAKWWKAEAEAKAQQLTEAHDNIIKGKCPCCNRKFVSLRKHIEKAHPEYRERV